MPGKDFVSGLGMPDLDKYESMEDKLEAIRSSIYMLLENLQYTLRHLDASNMNGTEMEKWLAGTINANEIISKTLISDEIYSDYGEIADLTASRLRTDYMKARRWLNGDTDPLDYLDIHDEQIEFISGSVHYEEAGGIQIPTDEQLLAYDGSPFFWRDRSMTQMTSRKRTPWPVYVYRYDELVKGKLCFENLVIPGGFTKLPVIKLGAGSDPAPGHESYGKAEILKDVDGLFIKYVTGTGTPMSAGMTDEGKITLFANSAPTVIELGKGSDPAPGHESYGKAVFRKATDGMYIEYVTGTGTPMSVTMKDSGEAAINVGNAVTVKVSGSEAALAVSGGAAVKVNGSGAYYHNDEISTKADPLTPAQEARVVEIVASMLPTT